MSSLNVMAGFNMKQLIYIGGGESFLKHQDFVERLKSKPLWHLPEESNITITKFWKESLAEELGSDWQVIIPPMPNRENAKYEEWKIWFERHFEYLHDSAIVAGCSLGAMFLGRYLTENKLPFKAGAIILMAGAIPLAGEDHTDYGDFLIDLKAVSNVTVNNMNVVIMHSKDDFLVPFSHGEQFAKALPEAEFIVFEDKNHFLVEEFPELIEKIRGLG